MRTKSAHTRWSLLIFTIGVVYDEDAEYGGIGRGVKI